MSYKEIISDNCKNYSAVSWWPHFAYHYTDVTNAVSILSSGMLYSRMNANQMGIMKNNTASRQVITMTHTEAVSHVRFYFRSLTPTQYYNEGYKHPQLRYDQDDHANTPVPIFFTFDLEKLLTIPGVQFSEQKQSGFGSPLMSGEASFAGINFDAVYSKGPQNFNAVKNYRHAEILYPDAFEIDSCLHSVLCRNAVEKSTLLHLLRYKNPFAFQKYENRIKIFSENMFEENGLFITECRYHNQGLHISFSDSFLRKKYIRTMKERNSIQALTPVQAEIQLDWYNRQRAIYHSAIGIEIDYEAPEDLQIRDIPQYDSASTLGVRVFFDDKLMCFMEFPLKEYELMK